VPESEKYITSKGKTKTKQNASAGRTTEMMTTSEQLLIPEGHGRRHRPPANTPV
jgi:hypothetical protein